MLNNKEQKLMIISTKFKEGTKVHYQMGSLIIHGIVCPEWLANVHREHWLKYNNTDQAWKAYDQWLEEDAYPDDSPEVPRVWAFWNGELKPASIKENVVFSEETMPTYKLGTKFTIKYTRGILGIDEELKLILCRINKKSVGIIVTTYSNWDVAHSFISTNDLRVADYYENKEYPLSDFLSYSIIPFVREIGDKHD